MSVPANSSRVRRAWARLLTGPAGHLVGGALDVSGALARYWLARAPARFSAAPALRRRWPWQRGR